jgi:hypothetical protein
MPEGMRWRIRLPNADRGQLVVQPLTLVAYLGTASGEAPEWRNIEITVRFD